MRLAISLLLLLLRGYLFDLAAFRRSALEPLVELRFELVAGLVALERGQSLVLRLS